tara:strand:- start:1570 stop:2103 length:534 start_codon:yes stop_codon:yes gene_type:complete
MAFENNIFINCPFDSKYKPILKAIIFCTVYLDYKPLLSETINSADSRVNGILDLISNSKYSIHDLSRMEASKKNELARFNMPFELGMDIGCKRFGSDSQKEKCFLILDKLKFRYQKSISDISGNDISIHNEEPEKALRQVRNWIRKIDGNHIDSPNKIWRLIMNSTEIFTKSHKMMN